MGCMLCSLIYEHSMQSPFLTSVLFHHLKYWVICYQSNEIICLIHTKFMSPNLTFLNIIYIFMCVHYNNLNVGIVQTIYPSNSLPSHLRTYLHDYVSIYLFI